MSLSDREFKEFLDAIDRTLAAFGGRPAEPGVDLELYYELRRIRETMIRARRDVGDSNVRRDKQPPKKAES
jgi:hypothetical protein